MYFLTKLLHKSGEVSFLCSVKVFFAVVDVKNVECDENKVAQKEILTPFAFAAVTALLVDHANEALLLAPVVGFTV